MDLTANELSDEFDDDTQSDLVDFPEAAYDVLFNIDIAGIASEFVYSQNANGQNNLFVACSSHLGQSEQTSYKELLEFAASPM